MKTWILLAGWCALAFNAAGQDLTWLVEQAPTVSMTLAKVLGTSPSFTARVELEVSGKADPVPSAASGTLEFQGGNLRWQARLEDINSAQLTKNARAIVKQINGDRLLLLTRTDQQVSYLVLSGAQACLAQALPTLKLSATKGQPGNETLDGHPCAKERLVTAGQDGSANEVIVWRAKDLQNVPLQIQITVSGETFQIRLKEVHFQKVTLDRFEVPAGLARYANVEDLMQSVLLEKVKKRMGLE